MKTITIDIEYNGEAESWDEIRDHAENNKIKNVFIGSKEFVNVVRCKECKFNFDGLCDYEGVTSNALVEPDWFCADGERRKKQEDE